jgi:hypothetical protein
MFFGSNVGLFLVKHCLGMVFGVPPDFTFVVHSPHCYSC